MSKKILCISDDIRYFSGVAIQSRKLLTGLARNNWEVVQIGVSRLYHPPKPVLVDGVKVYPTNDGYGTPQMLRAILTIEKPDILLLFNDPRFFIWCFEMDNEIRPYAKVVYWHLWDNEPYPRFNTKWYVSVDKIVSISEFTHNLLTSNGVSSTFIPHMYDGNEFYRMSVEKRKESREEFLERTKLKDIDFIAFVNGRNIERKRIPDTILAYKRFFKRHPNSVLILHTDIVDPDGVDLHRFCNEVESGNEVIIFSEGQQPTERLLHTYNLANVTVGVPYNEGFGLYVGESLLCGTPVIATSTGGITAQMTDGTKEFGILLKPDVRAFAGNIRDSYIYRDFVSIDSIDAALETAYRNRNKLMWRELGKLGRRHILKNFSEGDVMQRWEDFLGMVAKELSVYRRWSIVSV